MDINQQKLEQDLISEAEVELDNKVNNEEPNKSEKDLLEEERHDNCIDKDSCDCDEKCGCKDNGNCKDKCDCDEDCDCHEKCDCGEDCDCHDKCDCGEDCDCHDKCDCGEDCDCHDKCDCGENCDCHDKKGCDKSCDSEKNRVDQDLMSKEETEFIEGGKSEENDFDREGILEEEVVTDITEEGYYPGTTEEEIIREETDIVPEDQEDIYDEENLYNEEDILDRNNINPENDRLRNNQNIDEYKISKENIEEIERSHPEDN